MFFLLRDKNMRRFFLGKPAFGSAMDILYGAYCYFAHDRLYSFHYAGGGGRQGLYKARVAAAYYYRYPCIDRSMLWALFKYNCLSRHYCGPAVCTCFCWHSQLVKL
jgi:hypothetical protein